MQSMPYYQQQAQQQQGYQPQAPYQAQPQAPNVLNNGPMLSHPNGLPPMQHPGLPDPSQQAMAAGSQQAPKRKQVKNACTNCQKACKKCDDARPCPRCIKYGIADTCINSVRKERKKGIKRGPYKRRQKTGEEKPRKNAAEMPDQNTQPAQYAPAMRGPAMPFGYPSNLNQYGQQHYDPYGQYANYHKDQMMPQPYVVNPVYPPMGYPVIVASGENNQQQQQQPQQQQQQPQYQHNNYMMHQANPQQVSRPPIMGQHNEHVMHQSPSGSPQIYYQQSQPQQQQQPQHQQQQQHQHQHQQHQQHQHQQHSQQQQHSQPSSQRNSPHLSEAVKSEPVPSASTSTNTSSSPDSGN